MTTTNKGSSGIGIMLLVCLTVAVFVFPGFLKFAKDVFGVLMWPALIMFLGFAFWLYIYAPYMQATQPARILKKKQKEQAEEKRLMEVSLQKERVQQKRRELKAIEHTKIELICADIRKLPKYQTWRRDVFEKWGNVCEHCSIGVNLEIHHRQSLYSIVKRNKVTDTYKAIECDVLWDPNNGSVLCGFCHEEMESSKQRKVFSEKTNPADNDY